MIGGPSGAAYRGSPAPAGGEAALRRAANDLEAVFIGQLFQAMQKTTFPSSLIERTPAEDLFRSFLNDLMASQTAARMSRGIGDRLYEQLKGAMEQDAKEQERG